MDSIDKLLAQIKAEYQESDKPEQAKQSIIEKAKSGEKFKDEVSPTSRHAGFYNGGSPTPVSSSQASPLAGFPRLKDLVRETRPRNWLCNEPAQPFNTEASLDSLLSEVEAGKSTNQQPSTKLNQPSKNTASLNNILSDIKADYEAQERAEQQLKESQLKEQEQIRQQQRHQQELALQQTAIAWLKELDPLSSEGLWFEKFAESYDSKIAAAIAYLQTD